MRRDLCAFGVLVAALTCSSAMAVPLAYEGFDYPNDNPALDGKAGGTGWVAPWISTASPMNLTADDMSLDSAVFPFNPVGDRVFSSAGAAAIASREFSGINLSQDGNFLYASLLIKKDGNPVTSTGGNNLELNLGVNGGQQIRLGSTSAHAVFLGVATNATGMTVLEDTYFMILKVTSNATLPDLVQASFFGPSDTVPGADPANWALTWETDLASTINTARLWVGAGATGALDELRLGTSWGDVAFFDPAFVQGDFNNNGALDIGDYNILANNLFSGTTYAQGDFDGNGAVNLSDFIGFRTAFHAAGFSLALDLVPEPASATLLLLAFALLGSHYRRHGTR